MKNILTLILFFPIALSAQIEDGRIIVGLDYGFVEDIAFGLRSLGIQNKSNIAIISNNSPRWAMCDYGIICSAMTTVTIYPTLINSQVEFILKDSNSELIFVENLEQLNKIEKVSSSCENLKYIVVMDDS